MRVLSLLALGIVALVLWSLLALPSGRPSVVLITIDTLRPDRLGCYGHPTNRTPAIDRLAREGMLFEAAYCDMPWTTGSMASVMTGEYASHHGVQLPIHRLKPEATTLAERLQAEGYQTGAIVGSFPLDSIYGLDQGFETYDDEFRLPMIAVPGRATERVGSDLPDDLAEQAAFVARKFQNDAYRSDEDVTDAAIRWLDTTWDGRPFFLWVHYFGPHEKLRGDTSFVSQEPDVIAAYDADVEASDRAVGHLLGHLSALRLLDQALVILHADHGQSLGEHGYVGHGLSLSEVSVRIPLILRYRRGLPAGLRRQDVARNIDIVATVLEVTLGDTSAPARGRSLVPGSVSRDGEPGVAYFETYLPTLVPVPIPGPGGTVLGPAKHVGMRTADWKLVTTEVVGPCTRGIAPKRNPFGTWVLTDPVPLDLKACEKVRTSELYARGHAETATANVARMHPDVVAELTMALRAQVDGVAVLRDEFRLSAEQEQKLRSLGYLQ